MGHCMLAEDPTPADTHAVSFCLFSFRLFSLLLLFFRASAVRSLVGKRNDANAMVHNDLTCWSVQVAQDVSRGGEIILRSNSPWGFCPGRVPDSQ